MRNLNKKVTKVINESNILRLNESSNAFRNFFNAVRREDMNNVRKSLSNLLQTGDKLDKDLADMVVTNFERTLSKVYQNNM